MQDGIDPTNTKNYTKERYENALKSFPLAKTGEKIVDPESGLEFVVLQEDTEKYINEKNKKELIEILGTIKDDEKINEEKITNNGWQYLATGLQFKVYTKGDKVIKIPLTDKDIQSRIDLWDLYKKEGITLEMSKKERKIAIDFIQKHPMDKSIVGNAIIYNNMIIEQDKCKMIDEIVAEYESTEVYDKIRDIFEKYAKETILQSRRLGFCERKFNFTINNGVNKKGEVIIVDFGEITKDKKTIEKLIQQKKREKSHSFETLNDHSKKIFKDVMNKYIDLENLNTNRKKEV